MRVAESEVGSGRDQWQPVLSPSPGTQIEDVDVFASHIIWCHPPSPLSPLPSHSHNNFLTTPSTALFGPMVTRRAALGQPRYAASSSSGSPSPSLVMQTQLTESVAWCMKLRAIGRSAAGAGV
jgi:hypothetical protein